MNVVCCLYTNIPNENLVCKHAHMLVYIEYMYMYMHVKGK